ncbi:MAG: hypothetical protein IIB21_04540, partial [Chloroflexi bacterium]|nr:hypothetical protein [Chloroflexota bacterium]
MNNTNILELADFMEDQTDFQFDMIKSNVASCSTAGCVGGFAAAYWPELIGVALYSGEPHCDLTAVKKKLELSSIEADILFHLGGYNPDG